ncbi:hypothetical protein PGT21_020269 [Puccinia graminis f. sp. tritici]|uniref:Uncharacterized protein n=1 Tax=Puccinia graminis f. sp. tritici TaxID=56615 RepID=A0A5B0MVY0_PUCGR|nr:hypothetical protein PGT21_020269 [Puccinia graminis f. sp. tritici]
MLLKLELRPPQVTPLPHGSQVPCIWIKGDQLMPSSGGRSKNGVEIHIKALNRWPLMSCPATTVDNNKIKPLALHEYMEKKKNKARTKAKRTGGSQTQSAPGTQSVAVVCQPG